MDKLTKTERILTRFYGFFVTFIGIFWIPLYIVIGLLWHLVSKSSGFAMEAWTEMTGLPKIIELPRSRKAREVAERLKGKENGG